MGAAGAGGSRAPGASHGSGVRSPSTFRHRFRLAAGDRPAGRRRRSGAASPSCRPRSPAEDERCIPCSHGQPGTHPCAAVGARTDPLPSRRTSRCPAGKPALRRRSGPRHARARAEAADRTGTPPGRPRRSRQPLGMPRRPWQPTRVQYAEGSSWEPVEVPKPTYVEAPKAERAAPMPLDLPEAPKAVGKPSLKQASARPAASDPQTADDSESKQLSKAQSALSNLDDVLQRRRA